MADISKLNGYTIRDDTARTQINTINNTTIPAINRRIDALGEVGKLYDGVHIVLAGDSNWASMPDSSLARLRNIMNATTSNISAGGAKWKETYQQVTNYSGTEPDIFLLNSLGSDILGNIWSYDLGGLWGAPDVRDHTVPNMNVSANQTTFNYMKATYKYIRDTYPRARIYVMVRANRFGKPRSSWYYLKFYEQQIAQEWGVPVIDGNNVMNLTGFNETQLAIFNQSDQQHYNTEGYNRMADVLAYMLESNGTISYSQMPDQYFVPSSEVSTSQSADRLTNMRPLVAWVCAHCAPMYTNHWGMNGRAVAKMGTSFQSVRFIANCAYNDDLEYDAEGIMWSKDAKKLIKVHQDNYGGSVTRDAQEIYSRESVDTTTAGTLDLATLDAGFYTFSDAGATALINNGMLPAGTAGGVLFVARLGQYTGSGNDNRMYWYISRARGAYIGSSWAGQAPIWVKVTTTTI